MNSRDRVFLALVCKEADRVPIGELVIEQTVVEKFNRIYGTAYQDCVDFALGQGVDLVGDRADFGRVETFGDGTYTDKWGCLYKPYSAHPLKGPIEYDDSLKTYTFPDPDDPALLGRLEAFVKKAGKQIAINFHGRVAFMWSVYLMGMDNLLMAMALKPDFVHELFTRVADVNIRLIKTQSAPARIPSLSAMIIVPTRGR